MNYQKAFGWLCSVGIICFSFNLRFSAPCFWSTCSDVKKRESSYHGPGVRQCFLSVIWRNITQHPGQLGILSFRPLITGPPGFCYICRVPCGSQTHTGAASVAAIMFKVVFGQIQLRLPQLSKHAYTTHNSQKTKCQHKSLEEKKVIKVHSSLIETEITTMAPLESASSQELFKGAAERAAQHKWLVCPCGKMAATRL